MPVDGRQPFGKQHQSDDAASFTFRAGANPEYAGFGGFDRLCGTR